MNVKSLDNIAEDLFNKIRGRFPSVTIGNENGELTSDPLTARFFDFDFKEGDRSLGKVSISITEDSLSVMYGTDFVENEDATTRSTWYDFLKELRSFAKKRLLNFDTRDITKSNLNQRDYKFLAQNKGGDEVMSESKLYGTSRVSYQDIGTARLNIRHTEGINQESATGRIQKIGKIYIESSEGERFKYPYKHLSGARAMAMYVSEGGKPYDDFGKHIVGLSEELYKLRKFKNYMGRSSVMAESLSDYMDVVKERIATVKKTIETLQKPTHYKEAFESFNPPVLEDVPEDVAENWIDQLTIKQFNEELKDVFPYIYKLVSEATKAKELGPEELVDEEDDNPCWKGYKMIGMKEKNGKEVPNCVPESEEVIDNAFNEMMGQFSEGYMSGYEKYHCKDCGCQMHNCKPDCNCQHDSHDETGSWWVDANGNGIPDVMESREEVKLPISEFILSHFDRESGQFPKGETAVLTMVEKEYGDKFITPAKQFIEMINNKVAEVMGYKDTDIEEGGPITHAIANSEVGDKIVKALDDRPTKGLSMVNLMKLAQEKLGPIWYNMIGLSDQEKQDLVPVLKNMGIEYDPNKTEELDRVRNLAGL